MTSKGAISTDNNNKDISSKTIFGSYSLFLEVSS